MVVDAVRTYLDAANGLTELSRKQAVAAAKTLLRANGAAAPAPVVADGEAPPRVGQSIQTLAGELIETSQANRAAVADLVRDEVRYALEQMDMVPRAEYERMVRRVAELERRMAARHAVERVLTPRGGASSTLPEPEESSRVSDVAKDTSAREAEDGEASEPAEVAEGTSAETVAAGGGEPATEPDADAEDTATEEDTAADTAEESAAGSGQDGSGVGAGQGESGPKTAAKSSASTTTNRGKAKPAAKTTRSRSTAKRTTKGKSAKK